MNDTSITTKMSGRGLAALISAALLSACGEQPREEEYIEDLHIIGTQAGKACDFETKFDDDCNCLGYEFSGHQEFQFMTFTYDATLEEPTQEDVMIHTYIRPITDAQVEPVVSAFYQINNAVSHKDGGITIYEGSNTVVGITAINQIENGETLTKSYDLRSAFDQAINGVEGPTVCESQLDDLTCEGLTFYKRFNEDGSHYCSLLPPDAESRKLPDLKLHTPFGEAHMSHDGHGKVVETWYGDM